MIRLASSPEPHIKGPNRSPMATLQPESVVRNRASGGLESEKEVPVSAGEPEQLRLPAMPGLPEGAPTSQGVEIPVPDWDELFHAVEARLKASVNFTTDCTHTEKPLAGFTGDVQFVVLDCLTALKQLHTALTHERHMHQQFEQGITNAQLVATHAPAGIVGVPVASLEIFSPALNHGFASLSASVEKNTGLKNGYAHCP